ncbi:MAG: hypothetical protein CMI54_04765 [Parcubacteria group bacterium]|nr:hypothetical protein [Parcubacteria group bacterium]|tara:strand:+ start:34897 stop:35223 length:327 start_codon:yes stop_codon:yes gene_type:complete
MKKLDELNERLARLDEKLEKLIKDHEAEVCALNDEKAMLEEVVAMMTAFLSEANEAFTTLCVAKIDGGVTSGDLKTYGETMGLEIPDELTADEEATQEGNVEALSPTG